MEKGKQIECFEDLIVWEQAIELAASVYSLRFQYPEPFTSFAECRSLLASDSEIALPEHTLNRLQASSYIEASVTKKNADELIAAAYLLSRKLGAYIKVRETRFT